MLMRANQAYSCRAEFNPTCAKSERTFNLLGSTGLMPLLRCATHDICLVRLFEALRLRYHFRLWNALIDTLR